MTYKKTIALVLAILMALSLAVPALAAGNPLRYVAIGDSTCNGFGLDGYSGSNCGKDSKVPDAYIFRFKEYLENKGYNVEFTNLALTGMRTNELDYFLNENIAKDDVDAFAKMRWEEYEDVYDTMDALREAYKTAIENADVISYDLTANTFGNYMLARIGEIFGVDIGFRWGYQDDSFNELMLHNGYDYRIPYKSEVRDLIEAVTNGAVSSDVIYEIEEAFLYSYASFVVTFNSTVEKIYELNSDVDLYVFGLNNMLDGVKLRIGSVVIDVGAIYAGFAEFINAYITNFDKNCGKYTYVPVSDGVETLSESMGKGNQTADLKDACLELLYGGNMLGDDAGYFINKLAYGNRGNSVTLAAAKAAWKSEESSELKQAVEHVLETFVKVAANTAPVDVSDTLALLTGGEGKTEAFEAVFTNYDTASEFGKGAAHITLMLLKNGTGIHPSPDGHEQKLSYLVKAYEGNVKANFYHLNNILNRVMDAILNILRSANPITAIRNTIRNIIASIKLPITIG